MTTVRLDISARSIVVRLPAHAFSMTIPNTISLQGKVIVGIGDVAVAPSAAQPEVVTTPAFDAASFDHVLAAAMTRWLLMESMKRSRIGWRHRFKLPELDVEWPAWGSIPAHRRRLFLESYRGFRVTVNGRPAVRPRLDVPFLRGMLGTRIDTGP